MRIRHRWLTLAALCLMAAPAWAQPAEEEAGDVSELEKDASGPLRERIRPVSGHLFQMKQRFELSPTLGVSFRDAFWTKILFGVAATYHFTETVGLSLRGGYTLSLVSSAAQICVSTNSQTGQPAGCRPPTREQLTTFNGQSANLAYGLMTFLSSIDFQWAPIYGKISLFAEKTVSFNMYLLLGPTVVMYGPQNAVTGGGNAGVGFRFFLNRWLTVRAELRDIIYYEQGYPQPDNNSLRNQLMAEFGLSLFFPDDFHEG